MSDNPTKKNAPTTAEVSLNWDGLMRFLGWQGSVAELKRVELDRADATVLPKPRASTGR